MSERVTRRLVIRGRVQGVGFRYAMLDAAARFGVTGWVCNRRDGSVEAVVQGDAQAVEAITRWARQGPPAAQVSGVEVAAADGDFASFEMRPTR